MFKLEFPFCGQFYEFMTIAISMWQDKSSHAYKQYFIFPFTLKRYLFSNWSWNIWGPCMSTRKHMCSSRYAKWNRSMFHETPRATRTNLTTNRCQSLQLKWQYMVTDFKIADLKAPLLVLKELVCLILTSLLHAKRHTTRVLVTYGCQEFRAYSTI